MSAFPGIMGSPGMVGSGQMLPPSAPGMPAPPGAVPGPGGMMGPAGDPGMGPQQPPMESDFEQAFFDIASSYLKDKAPLLMDHMVGFQVLDRDEDDQRAAGVFGFDVDGQELFAPVFFLNGELKGYELLYLKTDDMFVPLQENWINYILNRKPNLFGDSSEEGPNTYGRMQPDLRPFYESPMRNKYSSMHRPAPFDHDSKDLEKIATGPNGPALFMTLMRQMRANGSFAEDVCKFYPPERLSKIATLIKTSGNRVVDPDRKTLDTVVILDEADDPRTTLLEEGDKERISGGDVIVHDSRPDENASKAVPTLKHHRMFTPYRSGVYDILLRNGKFRKLLVFCNPVPIGRGSSRFTTLVDPETKAVANICNDEVWARMEHLQDWKGIFEKLPGQESMKQGGKYLLVNIKGEATIPFRVRSKVSSSDGPTDLDVIALSGLHSSTARRRRDQGRSPDDTRDTTYVEGDGVGSLDRIYTSMGPTPNETSFSENFAQPVSASSGDYCRRICLSGKPGICMSVLGTIQIVPDGFKAIKLSDKDINISIDPASEMDLDMGLEAVAPEVKITGQGSSVQIFSKKSGLDTPLRPWQALKVLIQGHGLREAVSRDLLKQARDDGEVSFRIKYAPGYPLVKSALVPLLQRGGGPTTPILPEPQLSYNSELNVTEHRPERRQLTAGIPAERGRHGGSYIIDPYDLRTLASAAETGQKEVFDTSMLGGLLKSMNTIDIVDKYLPDLMRGLDRTGRLILLLYWHNEQFKKRYGADDLPELEDSLKNVFKGVGDLVLFLKQRSIAGNRPLMDVNLEDIRS